MKKHCKDQSQFVFKIFTACHCLSSFLIYPAQCLIKVDKMSKEAIVPIGIYVNV